MVRVASLVISVLGCWAGRASSNSPDDRRRAIPSPWTSPTSMMPALCSSSVTFRVPSGLRPTLIRRHWFSPLTRSTWERRPASTCADRPRTLQQSAWAFPPSGSPGRCALEVRRVQFVPPDELSLDAGAECRYPRRPGRSRQVDHRRIRVRSITPHDRERRLLQTTPGPFMCDAAKHRVSSRQFQGGPATTSMNVRQLYPSETLDTPWVDHVTAIVRTHPVVPGFSDSDADGVPDDADNCRTSRIPLRPSVISMDRRRLRPLPGLCVQRQRRRPQRYR